MNKTLQEILEQIDRLEEVKKHCIYGSDFYCAIIKEQVRLDTLYSNIIENKHTIDKHNKY